MHQTTLAAGMGGYRAGKDSFSHDSTFDDGRVRGVSSAVGKAASIG